MKIVRGHYISEDVIAKILSAIIIKEGIPKSSADKLYQVKHAFDYVELVISYGKNEPKACPSSNHDKEEE